MKKILIYLWLKYNGDFEAIYNVIKNKEAVDMVEVENVATKEMQEKYCTLIDNDYPKYLKGKQNPPFVIEKSKIDWWNNRERYLDKYSNKIASYVYAIAVLNSSEGNWHVSFYEINKRFALDIPIEEDKELITLVVERLEEDYVGLLDEVVVIDDSFDLILGTDYIANDYDVDEEE